ncbi:MAG: hypothetical protein Q8P34_06940, partial [Bacteroidota bacterium]|nr:hypothetical protein [Bacteroidota bacterium]
MTVISFQFLNPVQVIAQTPGLIFERATGGGAAVLDPNGDGYTSKTTSGFQGNDQTDSEIPYVPLVFPMVEPDSDLGPGPDCGFTDFVDSGIEDPIQNYINLNNKWLFRMRMGHSSPNAKSYSILVDTDGKFGNSGPNADPDYTSSNPGFEIEIVLATKFGVFVYDVRTSVCNAPVISYTGTTNYQKSIALTTNCGNPDYFYDFYVDMSDITAKFGINASTPIRMAVVDNMAANKSTLCNPNSASDVGGTDCTGPLEVCFNQIINNYTPCPPGEYCPDRSSCPIITGTYTASSTVVSGTSTEANGTMVQVYINGVAAGGTVTVSGGNWSRNGLTLVALDEITAIAIAPGKGPS